MEAIEIKSTWSKIAALFTPSTIRGMIIVAGTLGWTWTEAKVQAWVAVISLLIYGGYEICRTDSAKKAIDYVKKNLKGASLSMLAIMAVMVFPGIINAQEICVEPQVAAGTYLLETDGGTPLEFTTFNSYNDPDGAWHCFDAIDTLTGGEHVFRVKAVDTSGWEGEWSVPFIAYRPGASQKWKIRK